MLLLSNGLEYTCRLTPSLILVLSIRTWIAVVFLKDNKFSV